MFQGKMGDQERPARRAALAKQAPPDLREARGTLVPLALLGRTAWQDHLDQQDHKGPLGLPGPPDVRDQDFLQDLMTWKAPGDPDSRTTRKALGDPTGWQPAELMGCRDSPAGLESRGILEYLGYQGPREKSVQVGPPGFLASPAERAWTEPRDQKEKKGPRERKATQGRMEWGSQAPPGLPDLRGLSSTCRSRTEQWPWPTESRASRGMRASPGQPGRRETWAPEACRAPRDPRARRGSRAQSPALTAECWAWPRKEPRGSPASEDPRVRMGGPGTRARLASPDDRAVLG